MQIENPYQKGSFAHQEFSTYITWYKDKTSDQLKSKFADLIERSKDYMRYSWKSMSEDRFQAEAISKIHEARFGTLLYDGEQPSEALIKACNAIHAALEARWEAAGSPVHGTEMLLSDLKKSPSLEMAKDGISMLKEWMDCAPSKQKAANEADKAAFEAMDQLEQKA